MSDTHTQEPHDEPLTASPGEQLKHQREKLGLSLQETADALHLRPAVVNGLERDNYEEIPIATYRRGYLRAYAKYLGIDETPVLEAYRERHGSLEAERSIAPVSATKPPSRMAALLFKLVTLLIIAGLIAVTIMWWQSRGGSAPPGLEDPAQRNTQTEMATPESAEQARSGQDRAPADVSEPALSDTSPVADAINAAREPAATEAPAPEEMTEATVPEQIAPEQTVPEQPPATPADITDAEPTTLADATTANTEGSDGMAEDSADSPSAAGNAPNTLELTFNEQSWTEIFDANNQRVFVGLQEPGTTASVEGEPPFRLTVGNATGVELRYQGDVVDLEARAGANNVARFTLEE
ncbi:DUF4115 domain-containing protein [Halomonas vilamensis]|uniref:DUF4115 domain-containing protein n=1 Tax=Vreelandella vilamensis TaxID=531309 RepID=A0ABU1H8H2_9GAMM|nr:RodZ domain-containing protein [Halomonas vilamensis]MDR5899818.1 DUF4115 domain-containing protein [Halomonas vilamensis]